MAYGNEKLSQAAPNTVWTTLTLKMQMELKEKYITLSKLSYSLNSEACSFTVFHDLTSSLGSCTANQYPSPTSTLRHNPGQENISEEKKKNTSEMFSFSIFRIKAVRKATIFKSLVLRLSAFYYRTLLLRTAAQGEICFHKGFQTIFIGPVTIIFESL